MNANEDKRTPGTHLGTSSSGLRRRPSMVARPDQVNWRAMAECIAARQEGEFLDTWRHILLAQSIADAALAAIPEAAAVVWSSGDDVVVMRSNEQAARDAGPDQRVLLDGLRRALSGEASPWRLTRVAAPAVPGRVLLAVRAVEPPTADLRLATWVHRYELTERKGRVLAHLVQGESNKEIAQALACAENTVELHVTGLLRAVGVQTRSALIARFWQEPVADWVR